MKLSVAIDDAVLLVLHTCFATPRPAAYVDPYLTPGWKWMVYLHSH